MTIYLQMLVITALFFSENLNKISEKPQNEDSTREIKFNVNCPLSKKNEKTQQCKVKYIQAPTQWVKL